jgi:ribonuclease R
MIDPERLARDILNAPSPVSLAELIRRYRVGGPDRRVLRRMLAELEQAGRIAKVRGKHYTAPTGRSARIIGRLEVTTKGFGFVRPDWSSLKGDPPFAGDLFIAPHDMGMALDGDTVRAEVIRRGEQGTSGVIREVIEHAHPRIVGWYQQRTRNTGEVIPRNARLNRRIEVAPPPKELNIQPFEWVDVEITEFTLPPEPLRGRITARLGADGDRGIDVLLVLRDRGIIEEFPKSVEAEVNPMRFRWAEDLQGRVDHRDLPTLTIDPATAKDFDDALSIEPLAEGGWRLYVHIADVAHFVRRGTALDREAAERATSVYPVDRVVPMLPGKLSNYLCSLVPNEDRLTMTAEMVISRDGLLLSKKVYSSVIQSDYRFTYEEVQAVFDHKAPENPAFAALLPVLGELRDCAAALRRRRFKRGALDLDIPEPKVVFDDAGKVADLVFYPRYESHQLVEECMLVANEAVAQFLESKNAPLLYRVHEIADEDRLERLAKVLRVFAIKLERDARGRITPPHLQKALEEAQKHPAGHILRRLVLRALKRAEYSPENLGHFGLASDSYCHFTSPIRRYPDIVVHRQIKAIEAGGKLAYRDEDDELFTLGEHTSARERRAQEAEWEAIAIKSLEFMQQFVGDEFDGHILSVHEFGLFVQLDRHPVEGFIKKTQLTDDRYDLDETGVRLVGRKSGRVLRVADPIRVRIDKVSPFAQQMDLTIVERDEKPKGRKGKRRK